MKYFSLKQMLEDLCAGLSDVRNGYKHPTDKYGYKVNTEPLITTGIIQEINLGKKYIRLVPREAMDTKTYMDLYWTELDKIDVSEGCLVSVVFETISLTTYSHYRGNLFNIRKITNELN